MELLNTDALNLKSCSIFTNYLKDIRNNKYVSYQVFKDSVESFITLTMREYLKGTDFENEKCFCIIGPIKDNGLFQPDTNVIIVNEVIIKQIYNGDLTKMTVLFHELNHFKIKYDILLGKVNNDLARVIKERLLWQSDSLLSGSKATIKEKDLDYINSDSLYYEQNYYLYSEEKIAEIEAARNFLYFLDKFNISLSEQEKRKLNEKVRTNKMEYQIYVRDISDNINFNSYYLDFEEAFDLLVKYNPNWLKHPQLQIEYYLDENQKVKKRTQEELKKLLEKETSEEKKEYISKLLNPEEKRIPSVRTYKPINHKIDINKANNIIKKKRTG